jgi:NADP-dependent aldehyde dehydrogenase
MNDTRFEDALVGTLRAAPAFAATSRDERARALVAMAARLDAHRDELVDLARVETHYSVEVLTGELQRTTDQLRFFGDVLEDGAYLERATDTDRGPADVHRLLVPLGLVAVFGSSNFPFAYGVAGGDSASALAAGCVVLVKEHPSHPLTCRAVLALLKEGLVECGLDADTINMVGGFDAGAALVTAPAVHAVGFTGSTAGGRALYDLAANRPSPIPFYGELGSLNPVVVTAAAAVERATAIGELLADSVLQRAGQMCTKPGVILVAEGGAGDEIVRTMDARFEVQEAVQLLNPTVRDQFVAGTRSLAADAAVRLVGGSLAPDSAAGAVRPALFEATSGEFEGVASLSEVFGPTSIVLRYRDASDARALLAELEPALVGGVHAATGDDPDAAELVQAILPGVGRVVWNAPTTGLAVGWATHHGGGYPASTSAHSSVGASAIRRWLRPVSYQGVPERFLPADLGAEGTAHRVDGVLSGVAASR